MAQFVYSLLSTEMNFPDKSGITIRHHLQCDIRETAMTHLVIFIQNRSDATGRLLEKTIRQTFPDTRQQVCRTLSELASCLFEPTPFTEPKILVLFADTKERLRQLIDLLEKFDDIKILLILPDADRNSFSLGHKLRPRFVITKDQGFDDLCAVIHKMIQSTQAKGGNSGE